jgi:hypothetical protein
LPNSVLGAVAGKWRSDHAVKGSVSGSLTHPFSPALPHIMGFMWGKATD